MIINQKFAVPGFAGDFENTPVSGVFSAISGLRFYSPSLGRFINQDPIQEQGGINLYGFAGNNSVSRWDVLGLDDTDEAAAPPPPPPTPAPPPPPGEIVPLEPFEVPGHKPTEGELAIENYNNNRLINDINSDRSIKTVVFNIPFVTYTPGGKGDPNKPDPTKPKCFELVVVDREGNVLSEPRVPAKDAYSNAFNVPKGTLIPVYVPPAVDPQSYVNTALANGKEATLQSFAPGKSQDFKSLKNGYLYDQYGNFNYGYQMALLSFDHGMAQSGAGMFRLIGDLFSQNFGKISQDSPNSYYNLPENAQAISMGYGAAFLNGKLAKKEIPCPKK